MMPMYCPNRHILEALLELTLEVVLERERILSGCPIFSGKDLNLSGQMQSVSSLRAAVQVVVLYKATQHLKTRTEKFHGSTTTESLGSSTTAKVVAQEFAGLEACVTENLAQFCRLECSFEFIPKRFGAKIRYKDLVRLRKQNECK